MATPVAGFVIEELRKIVSFVNGAPVVMSFTP
jgi:hypothetical protein